MATVDEKDKIVAGTLEKAVNVFNGQNTDDSEQNITQDEKPKEKSAAKETGKSGLEDENLENESSNEENIVNVLNKDSISNKIPSCAAADKTSDAESPGNKPEKNEHNKIDSLEQTETLDDSESLRLHLDTSEETPAVSSIKSRPEKSKKFTFDSDSENSDIEENKENDETVVNTEATTEKNSSKENVEKMQKVGNSDGKENVSAVLSDEEDIFTSNKAVKRKRLKFGSDSEDSGNEEKNRDGKVKENPKAALKNTSQLVQSSRQIYDLIDSDTDDSDSGSKIIEKPNSQPDSNSKRKIHRKILSSDSESDSSKKSKSRKTSNVQKNDMKSRQILDLIDSDSSDGEIAPKKSGKTYKIGDKKRIIDLLNESDDEKLLGDNENDGKSGEAEKKNRKSFSRVSKDSALQQIRSETQKLVRESSLSIPYHVPKQRTLQEFLNRKKTISLVPEAPTIAAKMQMFSDIVGKAVEEKEKEALEFFESSDSEEEKEPVNDETSTILSTEPVQSTPKITEVMESESFNAEVTKVMEGDVNNSNNKIAEHAENPDLQPVLSPVMEKPPESPKTAVVESTPTNIDSLFTLNEDSISNEIPSCAAADENSDAESTKNNNPTSCFSHLVDDELIFDLEKEANPPKPLSKPEKNHRKEIGSLGQAETLEDSESLRLHLDTFEETLAVSNNRTLAKEKLLAMNANTKPELHGDAGMTIDFVIDDFKAKRRGVEKLLSRFAQHTVNKKKTEHSKADAPGLVITLDDEESGVKKPAMTMTKFRQELKDQITLKRFEEWKRKEEDEETIQREEEALSEKVADFDNDVLNLDDEEEEELEDEESELEEDERLMRKERKRKTCAFADDEAEVSDDAEDEDDEEDEADDEGDEENEEKDTKIVKPKELKRIIRAFEEDDEEDSNISAVKVSDNDGNDPKILKMISDDMFDTDGPSTQSNDQSFLSLPRIISDVVLSSNNTGTARKPVDLKQWLGMQKKLFDTPPNDTVNENELMELCSGRFTQTNSSLPQSIEGLSGLLDQSQVNESTDSQLMDICSGKFVSQLPNVKIVESSPPVFEDETLRDIKLTLDDESQSPKKSLVPARIVSSESEDDDFGEQRQKKSKKQRKPMVFSDDEDDEEENEMSEEEDVMDEEEEYIDYDSEENEVIVPKKDIKKVAANFLEAEAELSESEWGSADEDEKGLDKFEVEAGDDEDIDQEEQRDSLGRILARQVLDQDQKEVNRLKEILFEDGDLYGEGSGRERKFKWKNIDELDLNDVNKLIDDDDINFGDEAEDENAAQLRKIRLEKQKFLEEQSKKGSDDMQEAFDESQFFQIGLKIATKQKYPSPETESSTTKEVHAMTKQHIVSNILAFSKSRMESSISQHTSRGSFLSRGNEELERIAMMTSDPEKVVLRTVNQKQFVFKTLSPSLNVENDKADSEKATKYRKRKPGPCGTPVNSKKQRVSKDLSSAKKLFSDNRIDPE